MNLHSVQVGGGPFISLHVDDVFVEDSTRDATPNEVRLRFAPSFVSVFFFAASV